MIIQVISIYFHSIEQIGPLSSKDDIKWGVVQTYYKKIQLYIFFQI